MLEKKRCIMVKFAAGDEQTRQKERLKAWMGSSLAEARPLFPGDEDQELSTIFEVYLQESANLGRVLDDLAVHEELEYAHVPEERKPV